MTSEDHVPNRPPARHALAANPDLEGALLRAGDAEHVAPDLAEQLRDQALLVPLRGAIAPEEPPATMDPSRAGTWPALIGDPDHPLLPAFTSADRLRDWRPGARFLALPMDVTLRLASLLEVDAVVVDPGAEHALGLLPERGATPDGDVQPSTPERGATPDGDVQPSTPEQEPEPGSGSESGRGVPPPFFAMHHPIRALAAPLRTDDLEAIARSLGEDPELAAIERIWAVELHAPNGTVRLVLAIHGEWADDGSSAVAALASRLHADLLAPGYLDVDVVALTDASLREEVAGLDDPIHPRGT